MGSINGIFAIIIFIATVACFFVNRKKQEQSLWLLGEKQNPANLSRNKLGL
jgi:hypothetical protein